MKSYDAVVVGGRVAGASTAMLLARAGARVALVDKGRRGTDKLSTLGLMRGGVLQLSRWGLLDAIRAAGTPVVRGTVFHYPDGEKVRVSIRPSVGVDGLYAPRRPLLDSVLVDTAEEAGVEVHHGTSVTALLRDRDGRVCGVSTVDGRGDAGHLLATTTVGADGLRSLVAEQVGARALHEGRTASAVMYRYIDGLATDGYEWSYGRAAAAGFIPTNDGATCVFVATTQDRMRRARRSGSENGFLTLLATASPELAERARTAAAATPIQGWSGRPALVRQPSGPGWALVGDAGQYQDPITAHGMTDALRDAELLANALIEGWGGLVPEAIALASYRTTRDRLSRRLLRTTEQLARFDWDDSDIRLLLREVSSSMSDEVDHLQALPAPTWVPPSRAGTPADRDVRAG
jgi:flavin-dependent dehydrogenase